ncbi:hypothetical protein DRQ21_01610 [Candidatus Fermentibacteria bacterium]|nr:MAG: hypothetical protein DRQ21_01610 [Candidatus Fermentibacteria bacterium]
MKMAVVIAALLLPAVLLASVTETVVPSTSEAYLAVAGTAMESGDFDVALLLYEKAVERNPHSREALAGRLIAFTRSCDSKEPGIMIAGQN